MAETFPTRSERLRDVLEVIAQAADELSLPDGPLPADSSPATKADAASDALTAALSFRGLRTVHSGADWDVSSRLGMVEVRLVPAHVPHDGELPFCDEYSPAQVLAAARLIADGASVLNALDEATDEDRARRAHDNGDLCHRGAGECDDCDRIRAFAARQAEAERYDDAREQRREDEREFASLRMGGL